jgi:hypothetical protein
MLPDSSPEQLLRSAACVELDDAARESLVRACAAQDDWEKTIREAELHGMAPYAHMRIKEAGLDIPAEIERKLKALTLRHSDASRIRTRALLEILENLGASDIEVLVLKGAALAHLIYDPPGLRPMSDVDLLVAPAHLERASRILADLGYSGVGDHSLLPDHHHLPTISRSLRGLCVSIEIHHNALTRDNIGSIHLGALSEPPQEFEVDGAPVRCLGHIDMLRHLCRHTLEPRETTKIGSALDIMLYAHRYAEAIDWARLRREYPEVITMIQLLGYLVPWPSRLSRYLPAPPPGPPSGVGFGMVPLSRLRHGQHRVARLLDPSDWWLRAFYNVPPGRSLIYTKTIRHPVRVLFWLWRRLGKAVQ